jgi:hypothetical protein
MVFACGLSYGCSCENARLLTFILRTWNLLLHLKQNRLVQMRHSLSACEYVFGQFSFKLDWKKKSLILYVRLIFIPQCCHNNPNPPLDKSLL